MTKQQYIDYWVDAAQYDWKGVEDAFNSEKKMRQNNLKFLEYDIS